MSKILYIEDIFLEFYQRTNSGSIGVQFQDLSPINSFYDKIVVGDQLTANQGSYLLKILEKYKKLAFLAGFDYASDLDNATWKVAFRVLDLSKKIYIEKNEKGKLEICLKFPYQLKQEFEKEIEVNSPQKNSAIWDHEKKIRKLNFYDCNLMQLYDFANKHSFQIDESFMCALADVEEIWQNEENVIPYSYIEGLYVRLKNTTRSVDEFFPTDRCWVKESSLLLAKSMGFYYAGKPENTIEKIAASSSNTFWIKSNGDFFRLYKQVGGKIAFILDRSADTLTWLQKFVADADEYSVSRDEIKICFRESKEEESGLNDWIKLAGVGGKVDSGNIFIFEHKPAKWLFKENIDVKIIVTNNLYPHTNQLTKDWLESHPCVIYLGDIKPSEQRGKKIVEL